MMHFPHGIGAHPVYSIDTPEEADFWARIRKAHEFKNVEKEEPTMKVSYNGFAGELVKLERKPDMKMFNSHVGYIYDLSIYDSEKQVTHSFAGVKMEDVKFLGGAVAFGG